jgi:hypothetical protein
MKIVGRLMIALLTLLAVMQLALAVDVGSGVGVNMETEKFPPLIWICDNRQVNDDYVEPGRISDGGSRLIERIENYAFEGEQVQWDVLVMDKNGVEKIKDVYMTVGEKQSGSLQRRCRLDDKRITVDGNITESDWKKVATASSTVNCTYEIYLANDYNNLYVGFKLSNSKCPKQDVFEMHLNQTAMDISVLPLATQSAKSSNAAEYKIPMVSLGITQGQSINAYFKAFFTCNRYPAKGWAKIDLEAEKCWMERVYNSIEANCMRSSPSECVGLEHCNARIGEEKITRFDPTTMAFYKCTFTVETPNSMSGEYFLVPEIEDLDGQKTPADENEYWYFNPVIAINIQGAVDFGTVRPGTQAYSDTLLVGNDADAGSGVLLDMFIAGTDFYDPMSSGAKCPTTNQLNLDNFRYFATNGAYGTQRFAVGPDGCVDDEGYSVIPHGDRITQAKEIIGCRVYHNGMMYQPGNVLSPGAEIALTFKLSLPEPCNGDFSDGQINFWGEAV